MYQKEIVIKWLIKGYDDYGFGEDDNLYNLKRNRKVKHCLKRYTRGFNLNGKFISDKNLKPLLFISTKKIHCPF
jgi:hypothetical protein